MGRDSTQAFDYGSVSTSVASFLRGQADRIKRGYTTSIVSIGKALIEAKHHLPHGAFMHWVESEVGIPPRTAQVYMRVAQWVKDKTATVAHLPPSLLYFLSARSVPERLASMLLDRLAAGERIDVAAARSALREFRESNGLARQSASRTEKHWRAEPALELGRSRALVEAVAILFRGLSRDDFCRVRRILTSESVVRDPHFATNIAVAFSTADSVRLQATCKRETSVAA